ncbi:membrane protein [Streptomyces lavendulae subsp. lavendulae]|nr:membrane protein [Streptomyces lavendulae subsp. lavendulae]
MAISVSVVVLLTVCVVLLVRKGGLKTGHALVCTLLGFYLASSSMAPAISQLAANVARLISGVKF